MVSGKYTLEQLRVQLFLLQVKKEGLTVEEVKEYNRLLKKLEGENVAT